MQEIETKILGVDKNEIEEKLNRLKADKISDGMLIVDWYGPKGITHNGDDPYFLRVRSYGNKKIEVTCKWNKKIVGKTIQCEEVDLLVDNHNKARALFEAIGLENYAHQEKKRTSWKLGNVQFDLDIYPKMFPFLEIEAESEKDIDEAIKNLDLENHETWNDGEKSLIEKKYKLNWSDMHF